MMLHEGTRMACKGKLKNKLTCSMCMNLSLHNIRILIIIQHWEMAIHFMLNTVLSGAELNLLFWSTGNNIQSQRSGCFLIKTLINRHTHNHFTSSLFYQRTLRKYFKIAAAVSCTCTFLMPSYRNCQSTHGKAVWCILVIVVVEHWKWCAKIK